MKIPDIFRPARSISSRLTWRITTIVMVIMTIISALLFVALWTVGAAFATYKYQGIIQFTSDRTSNVLTAVEVAVANNVPEVEEWINEPDKMGIIADRILRLNPNIVGSAIAFKPNFYKEKGVMYAPYAYHDGQEINIKQLGTRQYNYLEQEWFTRPQEEGHATWSDPYYDKGGGNMAMTTYSLPLFDSDSSMYAVITADISLDWIADLMVKADSINKADSGSIFFDDDEEDENEKAYYFIVSQDGTYITHPDKNRVLHKSIHDYAKETPAPQDDQLAQAMTAGERGAISLTENDKRGICFYAPIERTGWSMGVVVPVSVIIGAGMVLALNALAIIGVGLVVLFVLCNISIRHITKPIKRFAQSADEIAKGNIDAELPHIKTKDEMRRLYDSFLTMQQSLVRQIEQTKTVNAEKGRIEGELQIARQIQMSMLPKVFPPYPDRKDIDIFAMMEPAKEVGGDLYDFHLRNEKLFFCIGDVSGKGVPAAMVMSVTRALFRTQTIHESNPTKIMANINEVMATNQETSMFVTLFVGVLDMPTGRLRYCNAGHCAPMLIGDGVTPLDVVPNIPISILGDYKYVGQETMLTTGTTIFLYTDGLTEAENVRQELFGEERMTRAAEHIHDSAQPQPRLVVSGMKDAVKAYVAGAEQSDDLTMMAIQYKKQRHEDIRMKHSLTLPNDIETIPQLNEFIDTVAEEIQLDMPLTMSLNLAIEEAVVNVMNYAYPNGKRGTVNIEAYADNEWLTFVITDTGTPFDPTAKEEADTTLSVEERPIGGLGIFLIRQLMDSINYERTDGKNVLTVRKRMKNEQ